jgi:hypothetical protein
METASRDPSPGEEEGMRRLALLLSLTAAASLVWASPAPATEPQPLTISVSRPADVWSASGAFADSGSFVDSRVVFTSSLTYHAFRTFTGAAGTFRVRGDVRIVPTDTPGVFDVVGHWTIISGTGGYGNLHGGGRVSETFNAVTGSVVGVWTGSVHFD